MNILTQPLRELAEFEKLQVCLERAPGIYLAAGCLDSEKLHMIYGCQAGGKRKVICTYSEQRAQELYEEYRFYDRNVMFYPARDLLFYQADVQGSALTIRRMEVLRALLEKAEGTIIVTFDGLMDRLIPLDWFARGCLAIDMNTRTEPDKLASRLVTMGYERNFQVEAPGQFAVRGNLVDVFPLTEELPLRIEFWGDEIDSMRSFQTDSQRSVENLEEAVIYPASDFYVPEEIMDQGRSAIEKEYERQYQVLRKQMNTESAYRLKTAAEEVLESLRQHQPVVSLYSYIDYFIPETVSFLDYLPRDETLFFLDEPVRLEERGRAVEKEYRASMESRLEKGVILPGQTKVLLSAASVAARLSSRCGVGLSALEQAGSFQIRDRFYFHVTTVNGYQGDFPRLTKDLELYRRQKYRVLLLCPSGTRGKRLADDLRQYDLPAYYTEDMDREVEPGQIAIIRGQVKKGFSYPQIRFVVLTENDIFGKARKKKKVKKKYEGQHISSFQELKVGDYVVHENHGLGVYQGIEKIEVDQVAKDYIKISYRDGDNLYVLATQLELIQKYSGSEGKTPRLNKLGGQEWTRTRAKVRTAVGEMAKELVQLYAARQRLSGFQYGKDTVWQKEFEEMFPFEETEDQLLAIDAVKQDMESSRIMDRLICGDVGFGKTEVAIRAAFKAVQEDKQVAYLVPTTILAQQHYRTFSERMKDFPVRVDLLSRFRTPAQQKQTVEDLKKGAVDIVIGTHRVLSEDVAFKDLGLVIIDEEQRFGVKHKEKLKQLRNEVDVLTLTATPIPRTLHMSLIGIRDMSVLQEPPVDRVAIQTYVMEYEEELVREAILREMARGGQIYYVYNRVKGIEDIASRIAALVPDAQVAYAHGQMQERKLEQIMLDFINGEIDVLVSTTIIETGLDISNVNTMIIHDADNFGLSQLYQLRGRVGRSNRTAYAFLFYRPNKLLREEAEKRLTAIREFSDLGSGINIAMRDLEIRGAGNLLGARQHGHMEAIGYDLYCKMLNEAVLEEKGTPPAARFETVVDLDVDAYIPSSYIVNEFQKLDIYKRVAGIEREEECEDMTEELTDRFGDMPPSVENLLYIARIKTIAHSIYMKEVTQKKGVVYLKPVSGGKLDPRGLPSLLERCAPRLTFRGGQDPEFTFRFGGKQTEKEQRKELEELLRCMREFLAEDGARAGK